MPLQSVPDPFDDATHRQLDAALDEDTVGAEHFIRHTNHAAFLALTVSHSNHVLDHLSLREARAFVTTYGSLQDMLSDAWKRKSYREIRSLGTCRLPPHHLARITDRWSSYPARTRNYTKLRRSGSSRSALSFFPDYPKPLSLSRCTLQVVEVFRGRIPGRCG